MKWGEGEGLLSLDLFFFFQTNFIIQKNEVLELGWK